MVFLGYEKGTGVRDIDEDAFTAGLPGLRHHRALPCLLWPGVGLGITFGYDFDLVYADAAFEDAFFSYLDSIAVDKPLTQFQA